MYADAVLIAGVSRLVEAAMVVYERRTRYIQSKLKVRKFFESTPFQITVAGLICANFLFNIAEAQILTGYSHPKARCPQC